MGGCVSVHVCVWVRSIPVVYKGAGYIDKKSPRRVVLMEETQVFCQSKSFDLQKSEASHSRKCTRVKGRDAIIIQLPAGAE